MCWVFKNPSHFTALLFIEIHFIDKPTCFYSLSPPNSQLRDYEQNPPFVQVTGQVCIIAEIKSYFHWCTKSHFFPQRPPDVSELPNPCEFTVSMPQNHHLWWRSLHLDTNFSLFLLLKIKVNVTKLLNKPQVQLLKLYPSINKDSSELWLFLCL